ncbi:hypothetical protein SAPIO_CDS6659 [Scedosporium apiospermum]|uniref:RNA binding protein Nrd1 n=1 Tax=Pseudallescheria apiosperma TaxID=563466 RepID=A0A084G3E0_PSEDA|nr:uncharacterized protein SAPIO_CDS6659 [Scedosporium apiospermum]KEZ41852.1 hypothetical protein SAPIO_CDS6659 [Scedosporium apiospermum]
MSAVAELEAGLTAMLQFKPPGVSTSRIKSLTDLCQKNIKDESLIVQKFYTHFKKAPGTHKLGVLYLIDSVVRKWVEQAKQNNQEISSTAQDGTFAAGVFRVTEIVPALMDNIIQSAPADQKDRIKKLVDIWERAQTFPPGYIAKFRRQLADGGATVSTTPPGSPPPGLPGSAPVPTQRPGAQPTAAPVPAAQPAPSGANIMEVLANIAKQSAVNPPKPTGTPPVAPSTSTPPAQVGAYGLPPTTTPTVVGYPQVQQPLAAAPAVPTTMPGFPAQYLAGLTSAQNLGIPALGAPAAYPAAAIPPAPAPAPPAPAAPAGAALSVDQVMLINTLINQGLKPEQISAILAAMSGTSTAPAAPAMPAFAQPQNGGWGPSGHGGHDHAPAGDRRGYRSRSRSKSPDRWGGGRDSRGGYDRHNRRSSSRERGGRDRGDYRHRSPMGRRERSPGDRPHEKPQKWVEMDHNLRPGHIKVLSRTLFVGGVTCSQAELHDLFSRVGHVQSVIINKEKRHAFVKMLTREYAIEAKNSMGEYKSGGLALRTRWGVGFGPRDCCDYETGISVIPIARLTEADRKWLLTAEYGGTGGAPIETGICVEEPDIEIGAGVSSKAISRRVQTDKGGAHGPKSTRPRDEEFHGPPGRGDRPRHRDVRRDDDGPSNRDGQYQNPLNPNLIPPGYAYGMQSMPTYPGYPYSQDSKPNGS